MNIFEIILSPFVFIIKQLFMLSYSITGDYGVSIILLSFFISALLLPVFILIEKAKKKDDVIKRKMQPLVDEIKRVYKGQERYYYLKTLNRQHNYSPFKALVPILSLLLQIPFFIAAYQFLENLEALKGVGFLFINDLSLADGLLGGVNFLPIAMTLVNLLTVYFYTRNGDKTERRQMLIVALVFLILLYNLPAALLLYWTMNNVFSFFRLFITNPEVFSRKAKINKEQSLLKQSIKDDLKNFILHSFILFVVLSILTVLIQWNWANKHTFDDFNIRISLSVLASLIIAVSIVIMRYLYKIYKYKLFEIKRTQSSTFFLGMFLSIYFFIAANYYYSGFNLLLAYFSVFASLIAQYIGFKHFYKQKGNISSLVRILSSIVLLVLFALQISNIIAIISGKSWDIELYNIQLLGKNPLLGLMKFGILFNLILSAFYINKYEFKPINIRLHWWIYLLSILYITGSILLWNPLITFSSFPDAFRFPAIELLIKNTPYFIAIVLFFVVIYALTPKQLKLILLFISVFISMVSFVNTTLIPIDLGSLQVNKYSEAINLAAPFYKYFFEVIVMFLIFHFIKYAFFIKQTTRLFWGLLILNGILILNSLGRSLYSERFFYKKDYLSGMQHIINFSKTEQNIVLIIPDMLQGWSMNKILKENPELIDKLSGFTWFPNTLSISRVTNTSMPAIIGGYNCTPDKLDMDKEHTIKQKMTSIVNTMVDKAHSIGAIVTSNKLPYTEMDEVDFDVELPYWHKSWDVFNEELNIGKSIDDGSGILIENALFYSMPIIIKPKIYNKGVWFDKYKKKSKINMNTWIAKEYNFIRLLPYISSTKSTKPTLNIVYSFTTHFPWNYIDDNGVLHENSSPYTTDKWFIKNIEKWFEWMKQNGVYDNTKIIIVSDHGVPWKRFDGKMDIDNPFKNINEEVVSLEWMLTLNPLLMVKDFDVNAPLKKEWQFMSNIDGQTFVFDNYADVKDSLSKPRSLQAYISWWVKDLDNKTQFSISHSYLVKDSIFDGNNWRKIK